MTIGGTEMWGGPVLRGLGWLAFLVAPVGRCPGGRASPRTAGCEARLDIGGIGLTLLGGMIAATLMSLAFAAR